MHYVNQTAHSCITRVLILPYISIRYRRTISPPCDGGIKVFFQNLRFKMTNSTETKNFLDFSDFLLAKFAHAAIFTAPS